ncbi:DNA mismatch repair protein [Clostridium sp. WLY-B-L2]|uniref:DNA mismatch repair protein n=1 Tax=Clostridium aromativorans TaxID=2836848 RepID=A0ABS8N6M6_9CLOT|nr:MutS family DNA mismatch repair protein [Clostridium aromativorans]MCC9295459.1 DNA mismatch repair protein [Clostridium aromativorans]
MNCIQKIYSRRKEHYYKLIRRQKNNALYISKLRFAIFLSGMFCSIFFYAKKFYYMSFSFLLAFLILFIFVIKIHCKLKENVNFTEKLWRINDNSLNRVEGNWNKFSKTGQEFKDKNHSYSEDLDLFGEGSLFQWMNCCKTYFGEKKLKDVLSGNIGSKQNIISRQKAVMELKHKLKWRQHFEAEASFIENGGKNILKIEKILETENPFYEKRYMIILFKTLPVITIALLIMSFVFHLFGNYVGYTAVIIQITLLIPGMKNRFNILDGVSEIKNSIMVYDKVIYMISREKFQCTYLNSLKEILYKKGETSIDAGRELRNLNKISENVSQRKNILYILINIFLLWDYQCTFAFEKWRVKNGRSIYNWIEAVSQFEMLNSLALIAFEHPYWTIPEILDTPLVFNAKSMAHPLLGDRAVCNDLTLKKPSNIVLITGSNMSGKSTLLRTAGVNLVLAYAGAPVRAKKFSCSIMNIYTCMRISDNLEENISSFYGEILRIKGIVEACGRGEQVFFLLDEIFKGTNSIDRHLGAKILIKNLENGKTCGMVSTHDLELAEMEEESGGKIKNYHFKEYYEDGKIKFDYKLRTGVSTTRNALYLMKMAGIDIGESPKQ